MNIRAHRTGGFTLVELLIVIAILGLLAAVSLPLYGQYLQQARQRTAMTELRSISDAAEMYFAANGAYPASLEELEPRYMRRTPTQDPWGAAYSYELAGGEYTVTSYGADQAPGPAPPPEWADEPYEVDIVMEMGAFIQAPGIQ